MEVCLAREKEKLYGGEETPIITSLLLEQPTSQLVITCVVRTCIDIDCSMHSVCSVTDVVI